MFTRAETWSFAANLAYGVTTVRDPQTGTTDILSYGDMVDAGLNAWPKNLLNWTWCWILGV